MDIDPTPDPVLAEVEAFLQTTQMTATAFGQQSLNDPTLVHELRKGRECKRVTRERIRHFMRAVNPAATAHAGRAA